MPQEATSEPVTTLGVGSGELDQMVADVRLLASGMHDANGDWPASTADLERTANNLLSHIEALPRRIADAIAEALAKQHRMIVADVQSALREYAARLDSSPQRLDHATGANPHSTAPD